MPIRVKEWFILNTTSRAQLEEKNINLEKERLILRGKTSAKRGFGGGKYATAPVINASELLIDSVLVTEVIGISPSPHSHNVTIDRGAEDNVYVGACARCNRADGSGHSSL